MSKQDVTILVRSVRDLVSAIRESDNDTRKKILDSTITNLIKVIHNNEV
jgi:hypothetical protein